jgi:DNA modification methylase
MIGQPWALAFALRNDGWWLRSDIIWFKKNPIPGSQTDRPTSAHEHVFLLAKSGTSQYWTHRDLPGTRKSPKPDYRYIHVTGYEEIEEPQDWKEGIITCPACDGEEKIPLHAETESLFDEETVWSYSECELCKDNDLEAGMVKEWTRINLWSGHDYYYDGEAIKTESKSLSKQSEQSNSFARTVNEPERPGQSQPQHREGRWPGIGKQHAEQRNRGESQQPMAASLKVGARDVWSIATQSFPDAHFATFPEELARRCILAGTSAKGCCGECGAPYERQIYVSYKNDTTTDGRPAKGNRHKSVGDSIDRVMGYTERTRRITETTGWRSTCDCNAEIVPCEVLDTFGGSGTVKKVAQEHGREAIIIELNPEYIPMIEKRTANNQQPINFGKITN